VCRQDPGRPTNACEAGVTSTRHFQLGSCSGARSEQNVPTHCIVNREPAPHNTYRIPYIASNLPPFFIDGSNWTIGDYSPTQSRKYAFVIVILIVLGKKKFHSRRRPCLLLPLNYGFNEKNDGKPQEKEEKKETVVKSHCITFSIEKARKAKNNVLVNCTTTDANHDRATARPTERTNETNERQDQKRETNGTISL